MKNETEKLNKFRHAVFQSADGQVEDIIAKAQQEQEESVSKAEVESESLVKAQLLAIDKECSSRAVREISSRKLASKRNVLLFRTKMIDNVFDNVKKNIADFCNSKDYEKYLSDRLSECAKENGSDNAKAFFAFRDKELGEKICAQAGFSPDTKETIELGGVMIVYEDRNLAFDYTFDYAFAQERENFCINAGGISE